MAENQPIQLVGTDFDEIKRNLINYLKSQDVLKDADYTGSVLSILMDILAYNTHYNSFYLNMIANEMFLDTAIKRSSLVSHAKTLGYVPYSYSCSTAIVDISFTGVTTQNLIIPKYSKFITEKIDDINYTFITDREYYALTDQYGNVNFDNVVLKQGTEASFRYTYTSSNNYNTKFKIPHDRVDLSTLQVVVQKSSTNISSEVYTRSEDISELGPDSKVYFIQESYDGKYEIYFGNGVLGASLQAGNIIFINYIVSEGGGPNGARDFSMVNPPGNYSTISIDLVREAISGQEKESIESIRYLSPKIYSAQGRAVTVNDYVTLIKKNSNRFPIDSVNVWSGEDNEPKAYGKIFVAIKPVSGYTLTETEKTFIKEEIIKPISVITVQPEIVEVDYTFVKVDASVLIDKNKTTLNDSDIKSLIVSDIQNYAETNLNSFESTLIIPNFTSSINSLDNCIITNEQKIVLQKRIYPEYNVKKNYSMNFGCPIRRGLLYKSVYFQDTIQYKDQNYNSIIRDEVFLEEAPASTTYIESIQILNEGFNYYSEPTVVILGDGYGATATANILDGKIKSITVTNQGQGYTQAVVNIYGGGGNLASAKVILSGRYGTLRTYYYSDGVKTILNPNIGSVDYLTGIVTLSDFSPVAINNSTGTLGVNIIPDSTIIQTDKNRLLTIDVNDPTAISVNILRK